MRWVPFAILVYVLLVAQSTLVGMITFDLGYMGKVAPDLLAMAAVFVVIGGPDLISVMAAAWMLGFALDMTAVGVVDTAAVVGPMSFAYATAAWIIFRMREAVFTKHAFTQAMLALLFCLVAHLIWVSVQVVMSGSWANYWQLVAQASGISIYTALLMPLGYWLLSSVQGLFIDVPVRRTRRTRMMGR